MSITRYWALYGSAQNLGLRFSGTSLSRSAGNRIQASESPFEREKAYVVSYKGLALSRTYKVDFLCYKSIIVELKALSHINKEHMAQILNYLKASHLKLGLLVNFGVTSLTHERILL